MALSCSMQIVLILLGKGITDKLIVGCTHGICHGLHQLSTKSLLETFNLLLFSVHKLRSTPSQIVESMHIFNEGLGSPCELHELCSLHPHKPWWYVMFPKGGLELIPTNISIGT